MSADALGETGVVENLLKELDAGASKKRTSAICVELGEERLVHQGVAWSELALTSIPKLLTLLQKSDTEGKDDLLLVLAQIASGSPHIHWQGRATPEESLAVLDAAPLVGDCRKAIAREPIEALLADKKPTVRTAAALLLGLLPPIKAAALEGRFAKEKDDKARGALYLCVSMWQRAYQRPLQLDDRAEAKPFPAVCRAAACAYVQELRNEQGSAILAAAIETPPAKGFDSEQIAFAALSAGYPGTARAVAVAGIKKGLFRANEIIAMFTPTKRSDTWADLPLFSALPAETQAFLRAVLDAIPKPKDSSDEFVHHATAFATGYPTRRPCARRWAGLDPAAIMERPLYYVGKWSWVDSVTVAVDAIGARDDAEAALIELLGEVRYGWDPLYVITALARVLARKSEMLPEAVDRLLSEACDSFRQLVPLVRETLRRIPVARRDAILNALKLPMAGGGSNCWNVRVEARPHGWAFLDLASDQKAAAEKAAQAIAQWTTPERSSDHLQEDDALALFKALGSASAPALRAAMRDTTPVGAAALERILTRLQ